MATTDPEVTRLGATVRALREARGIRVSDFCIHIGVTHGHLSNLESGRRKPSPERVVLIATELGVPVGALVPVDKHDYPLELITPAIWESNE